MLFGTGDLHTTVASTGLFRSFFFLFLLFASAASLHSVGRVLDGIEWDELVFFEFGRLGAYAEFVIQRITILRGWGGAWSMSTVVEWNLTGSVKGQLGGYPLIWRVERNCMRGGCNADAGCTIVASRWRE